MPSPSSRSGLFNLEPLVARLRVWRSVLSQRRGVVPIITAVLAAVGLYDLVVAQLLPEDAQSQIPTVGAALVSVAPWYVWALASLAVVLLGSLEGAYAVVTGLAAGSSEVEVYSSYPVFHHEQGVPPLGYYVLVGGLNVINRSPREIDCSLDLEVEIEGQIKVLEHVESAEVVNAPASLPDGLRGNHQFTEQVKIASGARAVGFAAFSADFLTTEQFTEGLTSIDALTLVVVDAINLVEVTRHEVWPWQWRSLLFGA